MGEKAWSAVTSQWLRHAALTKISSVKISQFLQEVLFRPLVFPKGIQRHGRNLRKEKNPRKYLGSPENKMQVSTKG